MQKFKLLFSVLALCLFGGLSAFAADTSVDTMVSDASGWWTAIKVVAVGVLGFTIARKLLRKL